MDPIILHGLTADPSANDEEAMTREVVFDPMPRRVAYSLYLAAMLVAFSPWIVAMIRVWLS